MRGLEQRKIAADDRHGAPVKVAERASPRAPFDAGTDELSDITTLLDRDLSDARSLDLVEREKPLIPCSLIYVPEPSWLDTVCSTLIVRRVTSRKPDGICETSAPA